MAHEEFILKNGDKILKNYFYRKHSQDKWRKVPKKYVGMIWCDLLYKVRRPYRTHKKSSDASQQEIKL